MNLNKVALYLEYIAFVLRREGDSQVSKKNIGGTPGDESNPHSLGDAATLPAEYGRASSQLENTSPPATVNGDGPPATPAKKPSVRHSWSSPIQAMARIEQEMNGLDLKQKKIVTSWFRATYFDIEGPVEGGPTEMRG